MLRHTFPERATGEQKQYYVHRMMSNLTWWRPTRLSIIYVGDEFRSWILMLVIASWYSFFYVSSFRIIWPLLRLSRAAYCRMVKPLLITIRYYWLVSFWSIVHTKRQSHKSVKRDIHSLYTGDTTKRRVNGVTLSVSEWKTNHWEYTYISDWDFRPKLNKHGLFSSLVLLDFRGPRLGETGTKYGVSILF